MGYVGSRTSSQGHFFKKKKKKNCVRSRGTNFCLILMKLNQNVCLNETLDKLENRSCLVKDNVTRFNLRKTFCTL